eukprot:gene9934-10089_t
MDSEVIVIDDAPAPPRKRQRKLRKLAEEPIVLDSDSSEDSHTQNQKRRQKAAQKRKRKSYDHDVDAGKKLPAKQPKKQKQKKQPEEKRTDEAGRTVRFSAQPSQAVYTRIQRALPGSAHRMFLISTKELAASGAEGGRSQEFTVLGATGNVYTVVVGRHPHCTCPDHARGNLCKHILFVMLRVLKLNINNPLVWQKALLTKEGTGEALVWCEEGCGNNMHKKCFDVWAATKSKNGSTITCVYCRAPWQGAEPGEYCCSGTRAVGWWWRAGSTSLQSLYGDENAMWINYHQSGRSLAGAARLYTGGYGGGRRYYRR